MAIGAWVDRPVPAAVGVPDAAITLFGKENRNTEDEVFALKEKNAAEAAGGPSRQGILDKVLCQGTLDVTDAKECQSGGLKP